MNISDLTQKALSRRNFLAGAGAIGATSVLEGCGQSNTAPVVTPDEDLLNFALNLEYLEAEFFLHAATGAGLASADVTGTGAAGTVTGGTKIAGLTPQQQDYLNEIAYTEQQHVRFLRGALGTVAVARPAIDIVNSFNALASAAGIGATFNPYANWDSFLVGSFIFEDVGVTAYSGAAPLISPTGITSGLLSYAAGIQAVEAYHAGSIRTFLTAAAVAGGSSYPYLGYANQVSTLRATLGGGNETPLTVPVSISTPSSIVAADPTTAIGYARTSDQVLHIVYGTGGGAGVSKGAFFPAGLNGTITFTTT